MVTALLLVPLMLIAALVVDIGNARDHRRQWQNAADAGALAATTVLYPAGSCTNGSAPPCFADATTAAMTFVAKNSTVTTSSWSSCSAGSGGMLPSLGYVPPGTSSCISYDSATAPRKVRVSAPTVSSPAFFAAFTGTSSFNVSASADATIGTDVKCTLCFLGSVDAGNGDFTVTGGGIAVDGNVSAGPNSVWTSSANQVVGTVSGGQFSPAVTPISAFGDPLAGLTLPPSYAGLGAKSDPCTDGPGIYASAVTLSPAKNKADCALQPGLYVVQNTWTLSNNTNLTGTGVTLYVQANNGYLDLKNGYVAISAPTNPTSSAAGIAGMAIVYDRANHNSLTLQGNGKTNITGGIYVAGGNLAFNGNSCFGISVGPIVAAGVDKANGNKSCVTVANAADQTIGHHLTYLSR